MIHETPVLLLTGYLGSGKTTLVNRILSNRRGIRFAVVVNDIGEVNIDAELIQKGGVVSQENDSLVALQNGCICCTLKMDLVEQLCDLMAQKCFDYIVIEASGICEPEPIAQTISSIGQMPYKYTKNGIPRLDCIATVVDASRLQSEFGCGDDLLKNDIGEEDLESLVIQQIEFCNLVILNKVSEVTPAELGRIREIVSALQPSARIIECDYGDVDFGQILHTGLFDFDQVAGSAGWIQGVEGPVPDADEAHEHHEHHHEHGHEGGEVEEYGIGTFVYYRREPFDLGKFDAFVARKMPKNVIRVKGICYFSEETDTCYLFEQVGRKIQMRDVGMWFATMPPDELSLMMARDASLRRDWDDLYGDRMQKIVFIGQHLDRDALTDDLDACLANR